MFERSEPEDRSGIEADDPCNSIVSCFVREYAVYNELLVTVWDKIAAGPRPAIWSQSALPNNKWFSRD
jgi:hypothetical protein